MKYKDANALLGDKSRVDVNKFVSIVREGDTIVAKQDGLPVVCYRSDNTFELHGDQRRSNETRALIHTLCPALINVENGKWIIDGCQFQDGIKIDANGKVVTS